MLAAHLSSLYINKCWFDLPDNKQMLTYGRQTMLSFVEKLKLMEDVSSKEETVVYNICGHWVLFKKEMTVY